MDNQDLNKIEWLPIANHSYDGLDYLRKWADPADWTGVQIKELLTTEQLKQKYNITHTQIAQRGKPIYKP